MSGSFEVLMGKQAESDLRLTDFTPHTMLRVPEHHVPRPRFPCIDFHNHLDGVDLDEVLRIMDACGIERMLHITMLSGERSLESIRQWRTTAPDRIDVCAWQDWSDIAEPGFFERSIERLERAIEAGACGLKMWKDLGLLVRDRDGRLLSIDDERLAPVFDKAAELGVFVMFHTTDPDAFFLPIDRRNERYEELIAHTDWSFQDSGVTKDEVLAQRDRVFARHPKTQFICAHVAEKAEDLSRVAAMLESCPNVSLDMSARAAELGRQPYTAHDFFVRFADRILFGADLPPSPEMYALYFRFLETRDEYFDYPTHASGQGRWKIYGLGLPDEVLKKVYYENARRLLSTTR